MGRIHKRPLQAAAGPRIAAHGGTGRSLGDLLEAAGSGPPAHRERQLQGPLPRRPGDLGLTSWLDLVPWSLARPRSRHRLVAAAAFALLGTVFVLTGWHEVLALAAGALAGFSLWRELRSPQRRAAGILEGTDLEIARGVGPGLLLPRLESALKADPENDGARFLLACLLFEEDRHLSALLQLAPLRDHHPDAGEVVLLAAAAYAHLELNEDALRLLRALDIDASHPSFPAAALLYRRAQPAARRSTAQHRPGPAEGTSDSTRMSS
jgi:hypothetical protein